MQNKIAAVYNQKSAGRRELIERFAPEAAKTVNRFHSTFPEYGVTPLRNLKNLAAELKVNKIWIKDESYRFNLNAFKVLGGSYCIGRYVAETLGINLAELPYERIVSGEIKEKLGEITFVTATDGNHGRGIAWTANRLGQKCVVYMPAGSALERLQHIRELGATASITDLNYDDTVRLAKRMAQENNWVLVQDTSWPGYEKIPGWIMEGYTTMAYEAMEQLEGMLPTHVFLQAGVGAMAGAITGFFAALCEEEQRPYITVVEPDQADCIFRTARAGDGTVHTVTGAMNTIMAGLSCGEPCTLGWEILRGYADSFVSIPDEIAAKGMRILGNPLGDDPRIISGESGAATLGFVAEVIQNPELGELRENLQLDGNSRILCISTEGNTDRANYRRIVWDGRYPIC